MRSPEQNQRILTVALMYLGDVSFMMSRTVPTTVGSTLVDDPALDIDLEVWGKILTAGTCGGISGKFVMGWMADRGRQTSFVCCRARAAARPAFVRS